MGRDGQSRDEDGERIENLSSERRALYEKLRSQASTEESATASEPEGRTAESSDQAPPPGAADETASGEAPGSEAPNAWEAWQRWAESAASAVGAGPSTAWTVPWPMPGGDPSVPPSGVDPTEAWRRFAAHGAGLGGGFPGAQAAGAGPAPPGPWDWVFAAQGPAGAAPPTGAEAGVGPSPGPFEGDEPVVALKKSGCHPPLFLVAPMLGSAFPYHYLALHLEPEQPLYGLQSPVFSGGELPETIPEAAKIYIQLMRRIQPQGPYYVGGYSFGAWTAFEIARQLLQAGEEVAFLGLLGTGAPPAVAFPLHAKAMEYQWDLMRSHGRLHRDTVLSDAERLAHRQAEAAASGTPLQRSLASNAQAALCYAPRPIELGLTLFLTSDVTSPNDHSLGWWVLCTREIDVCMHAGNHLNSFSEPHVEDLARKLCSRLRIARENP